MSIVVLFYVAFMIYGEYSAISLKCILINVIFNYSLTTFLSAYADLLFNIFAVESFVNSCEFFFLKAGEKKNVF